MVDKRGDPDPEGALNDLVGWGKVGSQIQVYYWADKGGGRFGELLNAFLPFGCLEDDIRWAPGQAATFVFKLIL